MGEEHGRPTLQWQCFALLHTIMIRAHHVKVAVKCIFQYQPKAPAAVTTTL